MSEGQLAGEPAKDKINVQDQERRIVNLEHKLDVAMANIHALFQEIKKIR